MLTALTDAFEVIPSKTLQNPPPISPQWNNGIKKISLTSNKYWAKQQITYLRGAFTILE